MPNFDGMSPLERILYHVGILDGIACCFITTTCALPKEILQSPQGGALEHLCLQLNEQLLMISEIADGEFEKEQEAIERNVTVMGAGRSR